MAKPTYRVKKYRNAARPHLKALVVWKDDSGKPQKKFFQLIKEAETFAQHRETELLNQGKEALGFPSWLRVAAQQCHSRLAARGKSLLDATDHFLAHLDSLEASVPIEAAIAEFRESKNNRSRALCAHYRSRIRFTLERFQKAFPAGKMVSTFTQLECEDWLAGTKVGPTTFNGFQALLGEFFGWCQKRGWTRENPCTAIERQKGIERPVGILTVDQIATLLESADTKMLPYVAIGAFAGLRAAELQRLDWSEIDFEEGFIEVKAEKAKSARRRLVKLQDSLRAWIEPFSQQSGRIAPSNIDYQLRKIAGRAGIEKWPHNALRHSFASYHLARFKNASELALEMGHTTNKLIFQHYRQVVRESQALLYWNILPGNPENVVQLAMRNADVLTRGEQDRLRNDSGRFKSHLWSDEYQHKQAHYVAQYGVGSKTVMKWMHIGKPLDDPAAMERMKRGEYAHSEAEQMAIYGATLSQVRHWRKSAWPLDNVERVKSYLAFSNARFREAFRGPANSTFRVIPLTPREAREAAAEPIATGCEAQA